MELTDSTDDRLRESKAETRSPLGIDLNEIPTSSSSFPETLPDPEPDPEPDPDLDSIDIVRAFHDNPDPAPGAPAVVPGDGRPAECGACRRPEARELVVVCDGCERGFHVACAGIAALQISSMAEWVCGDCVSGGVRSKRWPLGVKSKRILDINASPPSDGDGDGTEEVHELRKPTPGDNSFGGNAFGAPVTYSNFLFAGNGFGSQKASGVMAHSVKVGFEDVFSSHATDRSLEEVGLGFPLGRLRTGTNTAIRFSSRNPSEIFLQDLREFISERHGLLEEDWRVELKQSLNSFGLVSNHGPMETEIKTEGSPLQERLHLPKKRKSNKFPINGFSGNKESWTSGNSKEFPSSGQSTGTYSVKSGTLVKAMESDIVGNGGTRSEQINDGLPVQFEDFFVLSLGQVDVRPSYHDVNMIYPVGYRSCWHDKITGSLFICQVSDGISGPLFKVTRLPCYASSIPSGLTTLFQADLNHLSGQNNEEGDDISCKNCDWDSDVSIHTILSDPCPPKENDILTCLGEHNSVETFNRFQYEANPAIGNAENPTSSTVESRDEIGDISVESHSLSAAWRVISGKLVDLLYKIYEQKGNLKFLCKHLEKETGSVNWDMVDEKNKSNFASLAKFCCSQAPVSILSECRGQNEASTLANLLSKWLEQDRFGLDAGFVQEMIEQLPGAKACSKYEFLKKRSSYAASVTVGNGLLTVKREGRENVTEVSHGLFGKGKKPRLLDGHMMDDSCPPPGKPLCLRLSPELGGDFHQVWELFCRFHEILGLKEPFTIKELEEELINPWFGGSNLDKFEKEIQGTGAIDLHTNGVETLNLSTSKGSSLVVSKENPHAFIQMETEATKEAAETRVASVTYDRCFGVVLTKAHISLLQVLICELQSKVAALVDPNFDSGESRSRRGRKKDVDFSLPIKRTKINMLPINELTWPELARRYILSLLSMDGNLEAADIIARESGKVFRCLQGDGGVLCGSLTGVAGMEADAILLAEATKKIFGSLSRDNDILTLEEDEGSGVTGVHEKSTGDGSIPEWAQVLEPVRKLPTNVGTRIRKCVYEALEKGPPEWARKILEHSISKEVYKGNASGPTKKAVLSVLTDVHKLCTVQKSDKGIKKKIVIHISDIIMKQCRIVLRRAAAADDAKVFCNLLGRKLMNSNDNDDDGLLGSPAMVSRPLDFRTIDLRLAVGAYGGSHEAFLEDVRELWNNIRTAYADQPDFVELAETLSQNFESLYEAEVIILVKKFIGYTKSDCLNCEARKEINDILASANEIPKAPWDEGVCKVCGIDKDDDSVLLCDTCDAEYHTYCLSPPLARIPEGNWYCPSCVIGKDASECCKVISRRRGKKYQGEITRVYLETLTHLTAMMEEKEYWEFSVQERTFLLKFLCDELLSSALVRQHLEQCAETTAELQQKLRSSTAEWKNLKSREDFLASRVGKAETKIQKAAGEISANEGQAAGFTDLGKCMGQSYKVSDGISVFSDDPSIRESDRDRISLNGVSKHLSVSEKNLACNNIDNNTLDGGSQLQDAHSSVGDGKDPSSNHDKSYRLNDSALSNSLPPEADGSCGQMDIQGSLQEYSGNNITSASHYLPSLATNESQVDNTELKTIKNDILHLQESITSFESQLLSLSVRREFLGSDSRGRLYWISAMPGGHHHVIVDGSLAVKQNFFFLRLGDPVYRCSGLQSSPLHTKGSTLKGSSAPCPFLYNMNSAMTAYSSWTCYQNDMDIEELMQWLNDNDPKERELKESILNWQKLRFWDSQQIRNDLHNQNQTALSTSGNIEKASSNYLITKAAMLLEKRYGPCFELETDTLKRRGKKARTINDEKLYRCECLEPIWPSRGHCLLCHKTFSSDAEFEEHNDSRCSPGPANEKSKEIGESLKGKVNLKSDIPRDECNIEDKVETSKNRCSELISGLIKFQSEGSPCPYDFEDICSKFLTKDSNRELVQEIGLIGLAGIPSFIPSLSPFLSDSALMLVPHQKERGILGDDLRTGEVTFSVGNRNFINAGHENISDKSYRGTAANNFFELIKANGPTLRYSEQRDRSIDSLDRGGSCCVVPQTSLRTVVGKVSQILRRLKINLLDMDALLLEQALKPSKAHLERRWAWRAFVKSAATIYEMVQATILLEDMIKTEYLKNDWWYWSSLSAAVKISTISALSLRIYSLDAAIVYEKILSDLDPIDHLKPTSIPDQKLLSHLDMQEKCRTRKSNKKRKEPEG